MVLGLTRYLFIRSFVHSFIRYQFFCRSEITLIAPEYRGLFGSVAENSKDDVDITTDECVEDIREVMKHAKIDSFYMAMGWSLGIAINHSLTQSLTQSLTHSLTHLQLTY